MLITLISGEETIDFNYCSVLPTVKIPGARSFSTIPVHIGGGQKFTQQPFIPNRMHYTMREYNVPNLLSVPDIQVLNITRCPASSVISEGTWSKYQLDVPEGTRIMVQLRKKLNTDPVARQGVFSVVANTNGSLMSIELPFTSGVGAYLARECMEGTFYRSMPKFDDVPSGDIYKYFTLGDRELAIFHILEEEKKPRQKIRSDKVKTVSGKKILMKRKSKRSLKL